MDRFVLTPENYDGVTSALIGNGELCTTVGPTGFHTPPEEQTEIAHKSQHFVMAGRRRSGPQHPLINFGTLTCKIAIDGQSVEPVTKKQRINHYSGEVRSSFNFPVAPDLDPRIPRDPEAPRLHKVYPSLRGSTVCRIHLNQNAFYASLILINLDDRPHEVDVRIAYQFGELDAILESICEDGRVRISYRVDEHLGEITHYSTSRNQLLSRPASSIEVPLAMQNTPKGAVAEGTTTITRSDMCYVRAHVSFTDRIRYQFPIGFDENRPIDDANEESWYTYTKRSDVHTGDKIVDEFRRISLYTLRCQTTPWSIPPTVSEHYWGAGTFHDEMYPFLGLLSSNHAELAERVPYFRLSTLPQAMQRARGKGALYPWSSTEYGEERDPNGLWLAERFHLGQFAVCIWMLWLYNQDRVQLDDLYPVLKEIARYFELNMLERDPTGKLGTKPCVDFDESVGEVKNGPFTICAAIASFEYAANAAEILGKDTERIPRWRSLASELRQNPLTMDDGRWTIPDGKPLHYSVLGPIFPFRIEVDSPVALATAAHIHEVCRSTRGWKPGFSEVFEGSNWMWTAAHLGIVHALQGNGDLAWEAIKAAPESAGPFLSPNEHVDKDSVVHVPWFTTGCGGWLYALNCLFVQVDEEGAKLLPAVPSALPNAKFRDLRADYGVLVSGEFRDGRLISLSARAPQPLLWRFRIPAKYIQQNKPAGRIVKMDTPWLEIEMDVLGRENTSLLTYFDPAIH